MFNVSNKDLNKKKRITDNKTYLDERVEIYKLVIANQHCLNSILY